MTPQQLQQLLQQARAHAQAHDHTAALSDLCMALQYAPENPDLLFAAGNEARYCNHFEKAAQYFRRASELRTDFFAAHCNLGAALRELHRYTESIEPLKAAARLRPDLPALPLQLADCHLKAEQPDAARQVLEKALTAAPDNPEILCGLGNCAVKQNNLDKAKAFYVRTLQLQPDHPDAHYNLGTILREWSHLDEATNCFRNAVRFRPESTAPLVDLGETLQLLGETDESESVLRQALAIDPECSLAHDNLLVSMSYNPSHTRSAVEKAHRQWGNDFREISPVNILINNHKSNRKLKIGYLSPDFCNHPTASFLEPVLRYHDREQFELYCYSQTIRSDRKTDRFRQYTENWFIVEQLDDLALTDLIRSHGIDILIETAGHLCGNRLGAIARRAAPLQIGGIGYPGSRGLATMDYRISDVLIDPPEEESGSSETPLRLAPCFCCWQPPDNLPRVTPLSALSNGYITFGSLHTTARLNESVINLWSEVLRALPDSHLQLCRTTLTPSVIRRLSDWFTRNGIDLSRITFRTTIPQEGHLAVYNDIDISLDTLPWSGHTTCCESLVMGVPVLTLYGDRPAGRMVASVLTAVGLAEWTAASREEYAATACRFSQDLHSIGNLRSLLRKQVLTSPLCDGAAYTISFEEQLRELWNTRCSAFR